MKVHSISHFYNTQRNNSPQTPAPLQSVLVDTFTCSQNIVSSTQPSFKGSVFSKIFNKNAGEIIDKDKVVRILSNADIVDRNDMSSLAWTEDGYSRTRVDKIVQLHSLTKDIQSTYRLFKFCLSHDAFKEEVFRDIKNCYEQGLNNNQIWAIFRAATYYSLTKYNPEVTKFALGLSDEEKNDKNFADLLITSVNMDNYKFSQKHYMTIQNLRKNFDFSMENITDVPFLLHFFSEKVTEETEKQISKLHELGLSNEQIASILAGCKTVPDEKTIQSITQDLPKIVDEPTMLYEYLDARTGVSTTHNYTKVDGEKYQFDKESFDYFNELYKVCVEKRNNRDYKEIVANVIKRFKIESVKAKRNMQSFVFSALEYMPLFVVNQIVSEVEPHDYRKMLSLYESLNERDKRNFQELSKKIGNRYEYPRNAQAYLLFERLYPIYEKKISAFDLYSVLNKTIDADKKTSELKLKHAIENIEHPADRLQLEMSFINDGKIDKKRIKIFNYLLDNGYSIEDMHCAKMSGLLLWSIDAKVKKFLESDEGVERLIKLKKEKASVFYINEFMRQELAPQDLEKILDIRKEALEHRTELGLYGSNITRDRIDSLFFQEPIATATALKILGKNTLVQMFPKGIGYVEDLISQVGLPLLKEDSTLSKAAQTAFQKLVEITNPTESDRYIELDQKLKDLKKQFPQITDAKEKQELINSINDTTRQKNELVKNAIKDPNDIVNAAQVFSAVLTSDYDEDVVAGDELNIAKNLKNVEKLLPYMNAKTSEEKEAYANVLNDLIGDLYLSKKLSKETTKKLNLTNSKYLIHLFSPEPDFSRNFAGLLEILEKNRYQTPLEAFNSLEQNIKTRKLFKKYGLNYDSWVTFNPNSNLTVDIKIDTKNIKQNVLRNLEADFNDPAIDQIPEEEKEKLFSAVEQAGYEFKKEKGTLYDENGELVGAEVYKLYKDSKPIDFKDVHKIISAIKTEMNKNDFWNESNKDDDIDFAKDTLKDHFLNLRQQELKRVEQQNSSTVKTISVQKADMNDISHALFLGNDAGCCTAIGSGCNMWTAPIYIKDKFVSCIEVKDGDKFVGNTMVYAAVIDGAPALILDNIELKPEYQYVDEIRDCIFDYAQQIAKEIGRPDMEIYAGQNRHKVNMEKFPLQEKTINFLGDSNEEEVYIDFNEYLDCVKNGKSIQNDLFLVR